MKKVILYVGKFDLPNGTAAAQRVNVNKKILQNLHYDVRFISTFESDVDIKEYNKDFNINYISENKLLFDITYLKNIVIEIGEENIHSIIFYNFPSIALFRVNMFLKKKNINVYSDCTEWYGTPPRTTILRKVIKTVDTEIRMRYVHKKLDGIICISTYLKRYYDKKGLKTVLIPNVLDLSEQKWNITDSRNDATNIKLIYAGNPGKDFEKENLDLIVNVFNNETLSFFNIELNILGIEKDEFTEIYIKKYKKYPKLNKISFAGRKTHLEVLENVKNSDYFIFFRPISKANKAGFPTKLVESFGTLTPVITNDVGDVSRYINNGVNGYVLNTNDINILAKDLADILKKHRMYAVFQDELKINNPFDYKKYVADFDEFINKM
ncbi:MAG: glycosyltransferase [Firmicutes bacterium]|nr:glycosyltransferase [Bacillota bacterium]